jgi:hypothetical protein
MNEKGIKPTEEEVEAMIEQVKETCSYKGTIKLQEKVDQ